MRRSVWTLVPLLLLLLTACGGDRMPASPEPDDPHAAVTSWQAARILSTVDDALVRAAAAANLGAAGARVTGPAKEELATTFAIQAALKQPLSVPPTPNQPQLFVPRAGAWPRWLAAAGSAPAVSTPVLRVLMTPDARTPYGLWAQLSLLPGAALPRVAPASGGVPVLAPDAAGLLHSPADVVARYADVLNRGDVSAFAGDFTPDTYRQQLHLQLRDDRQTFLSANAGQVVDKHVSAGPALTLATSDGGALVIGRVEQLYTVTAAPNESFTVDARLGAMLGKTVLSKQVVRRSIEVLAFAVPKAGSTDKVTLVAANRVDVSAIGS